MSENRTDWRELVRNKTFPLSAKYDPQWVVDNQMGPNALWLTEWLCRGTWRLAEACASWTWAVAGR